MEPVITFIALFAAVFGIVYLHYTTRNKERMALIDKGADASLFNTGREGEKFRINWGKITLKVGMLFMGVSVGIIAGSIFFSLGIMEPAVSFTSMIFFFGGLSLVLFYIMDKKNK